MSVGTAIGGFALPFEALRLLLRDARLRRLAAIPVVASLLAVAAAAALLTSFSGELDAALRAWLPGAPLAHAWWSWLWVGPAQAGLWLLSKLLFVVIAVATLLASFLLAGVLVAPVLEHLSRRVEHLETGRVEEVAAEGLGATLRESLRAMLAEARRAASFALASGALVLAGLLVPGAALLVPVALAAFAIAFLPLEYAAPVLDRRGLSFAERRRWLGSRAPAALGFGGAAFLLCAIPGANLLALPVLVCAGTLLAVRHPPPPRAL